MQTTAHTIFSQNNRGGFLVLSTFRKQKPRLFLLCIVITNKENPRISLCVYFEELLCAKVKKKKIHSKNQICCEEFW